MRVRVRFWGRVLLLIASPMRLVGLMTHGDTVALQDFIATQGRSH